MVVEASNTLADKKPITVIIADDHELIRIGVAKIIRTCRDMQIIGEAPDMASLMRLLEVRRPDVLILDIGLPPYDNLEGLMQIRRLDPELPVLVLSMHPEERYAVSAVKSGAAGYITKAMAAEELVTAIRKVIARSTYVSARLAELLAAEVREPRRSAPHESLTRRELEVALLIATGKPTKQIAAELGISISSINTYRTRIFTKLGVHSNAALVRYIVEHNLGTN